MQPTSDDLSSRRRRWARLPQFGRFRYSAVEMLVALILLLVTAPFVERLPAGGLIELLLMTAVMVSAVLAVGGNRRSLAIAIVLAVPPLAFRWIGIVVDGGVVPLPAQAMPGVLFFGYVIWRILRAIHAAPRVDSNILCAGISAYLMLGVAWAALYQGVASMVPGAFALNGAPIDPEQTGGFVFLYFSFTTLTTLGLGDVVPVAPEARMLAMLEAATGVLFVAVLLARLVAMHGPLREPEH